MLRTLLIFSFTFTLIIADVVVDTENGQVKGYKRTTISNITYYSFLGIPYAQPPVGSLRLQPPQPALNWDGVLDVKENTRACYQYSTDDDTEDEDCLYLNIFTPTVTETTNTSLPVLVTIYGGGFKDGKALSTNPRTFIERDVVVVSLNYRLGPFGFLSALDEVIPGNYGLKDQTLALRWVQNNIAKFGGDPNKVTLNGQSTGGASVIYHYMSKLSEGLFRAGISESGSPLASLAYARDARQTAFALGHALNSSISENVTTSLELLQFLQSVSAKELDRAATKFSVYAPVVEPENETAFLTELMYEQIESGNIQKLPLLIGFNSEEALEQAADLETFKEFMTSYDNDLKKLVNVDTHITNEANLTGLGQAIRYMYTSGLLQDDLGASVQYLSDDLITRAVTRNAEIHSKFALVYFYIFSYRGILGNNNITVDGAGKVKHSEELRYLWINDDLNFDEYPESDETTSKRFATLFADFTKTLNPTPSVSELMQNITWLPIQSNSFNYLNIDEDLSMEINPKEFLYMNWKLIYDYYAVRPFDTY